MSYQDNMTLDEIASYDEDMVRDAIKNANKYRFTDARKALIFVGECIKNTLEFLGVKNALEMLQKNPAFLDRIQKVGNIRIERRDKYRGENLWRNGIYVYKDDVLATFIGEILKEVPHPLMRYKSDHQFGFVVVTNARVDRTSRFYHVPIIGGN